MSNYVDIKLLAPLQKLLDNRNVNIIIVDGWDRIHADQSGHLESVPSPFRDAKHLEQIIRGLLKSRKISAPSPLVRLRLSDGAWATITLPPVATDGPVMTIHKFGQLPPWESDGLTLFSASNKYSGKFLQACIKSRLNIIVSGSVQAGRNRLLNVIANMLPDDEHIVAVEDVAELELTQPHAVALRASPELDVATPELVAQALRMLPDRIIVQQIHAGAAADLLYAIDNDYNGALLGVHAYSPQDALSRLETMLIAARPTTLPSQARKLAASAVDIIVHLGKIRGGTCLITNIAETRGVHQGCTLLTDIYRFRQSGWENKSPIGRVWPTGETPRSVDRRSGAVIDMPASLFKETD